jgi:chromosome segregation ATPase
MSRVEKLSTNLEFKQATVDNMHAKLASFEDMLAAENERHAASADEVQKSREVREKLSASVRESKRFERELSLMLKQSTMDAKIAKRSLAKAGSILDERLRDGDKIDRHIVELEETVVRMTQRLRETEMRINESGASKEGVLESLREAQQSRTVHENDLKKLAGEVANMDRIQFDRDEAIRSMRALIHDSKSNVHLLERQIMDVKKEGDEITEELHDLAAQLSQNEAIHLAELGKKVTRQVEILSETRACRVKVEQRVTQITEEIAAVEVALKHEIKALHVLERDRHILESDLELKRENSLKLVSERDAANLELKELIREYMKFAGQVKVREQDIESLQQKLEAVTMDRTELESELSAKTSTLNELLTDLEERETVEREKDSQNIRLERSLSSLRKKLEDQKRILETKSERIREARLSEKSSELSMSLQGNIESIERNIQNALNNCSQIEVKLKRAREDGVKKSNLLNDLRERFQLISNIVTVRVNQKRRLNVEITRRKLGIKQKQKESEKLKFDIDKIGTLTLTFTDQITKLEAHMQSDVHVNANNFAVLNDKLQREVEDLTVQVPELERQRLELEKRITIEISVQKALMQSGLAPTDVKEIERTVNKMKSSLIDLNKKKETMRQCLLRLISKKDSLAAKAKASSHRAGLRHVAMTSCSTMASFSSLPSASNSGMQSSTALVLSGPVSHVNGLIQSKPLAGQTVDLRKELSLLSAQALALRKDRQETEKIREWIQLNSQLLP